MDNTNTCVRACVMITFNYQLQKEFKNHSSEFSILFDTIAVDVAVLK